MVSPELRCPRNSAWRWVGFAPRAGVRHLRNGRRRASFAPHLRGAPRRADSPWFGQGLLCQKRLRLDLDWSRFRRNRLGLLRDYLLRVGGWFVSFAHNHQDEREQERDAEDSAHNADGDLLGFTHGLVLYGPLCGPLSRKEAPSPGIPNERAVTTPMRRPP